MRDKFVQRLLVRWLIAASVGGVIGMLAAVGLRIPLAGAAMVGFVATVAAFIAFVFLLRPLVEPLHRLTVALREGEEPNTFLLRELGELGEGVAAAWRRWDAMLAKSREEQALLPAIVHRMAEALIAADGHGNILLVNPAAERLFRFSPQRQQRLRELSLPFELLELMQRALHSRAAQMGEVQVLHPEERFLDAYATPLFLDGKAVGVLLVARDLTELKRLERIRRDFVANVSHELRTPVATLRSLTEALLMGGKDDPEVCDQFLRAIAEEAERMGRLLENLLELARSESGRREWHWQSVPIGDLVAQVVERLSPIAEGKGLKVRLQVTPDLTVFSDPEALTQILTNLLDNAVKYTERGEITVVAERVTTADGEWVACHVRDTGIGIPPEHLPRIFERFYRVDKARSRRQGGVGLGLSIAKHLAESLGGKITVQSKVGEGSTFTLWLRADAGGKGDDKRVGRIGKSA